MSARLEGRTAIVTGGTGGIGSEICRRLAADGASVVVTGRNKERGDEVVRSIEATGGIATFIAADVSEDDAVAELINASVAHFGSVDVLVNNAAPVAPYPFGDFFGPDTKDFERVMQVAFFSAYFCCRHTIPHMLRAGKGAIVNISSTAGVLASPGLMHYGVSKAAMNQLSRYIAIDFGQRGVRCNTVITGLIKSRQAIDDMLTAVPGREDGFRQVTAGTRLGIPADIAHAVAFLASDEAEYINGADIPVEGGITARLPIPVLRASPTPHT